MPKPVSFPFPIRAVLPVNSAFGKRPLYGDFHSGVDFNSTTGAYLGTPVRAAGAGVVIESYDGNDPADGIDTNWAKLRGTMVNIDHGDGWRTRYHMLGPKTNIPVGSVVQAGDIIGHVGNSGSSGTGAHLHFELWKDGVAINPVGQLTYNPGAFAGLSGAETIEGFLMALTDAEQKELLVRMRNMDTLAAWLYGGGPDVPAGVGAPGTILRFVHDISDTVVAINKNTQPRKVVRSKNSQPTILPADGSSVTLDEVQDSADTNSLLRIVASRPSSGAVEIDYDKLATAIASKLPTATVLTKEDVVDAIKSVSLRAE